MHDRHSGKKKVITKVTIYVSIVLVLSILLATFALRFIQVPYTTLEVYEEQVPYEDIEYFNETENYTVRVSSIGYETSTKDVLLVQTPEDQLAPEPTFYRGRDCRFEDYNYSITYIGAPQTENDFEWRTETGYRKGRLIIGAEICNHEKRRLNGEFRICHMYGDRIADCQDTLDVRVRANTCDIQLLRWGTTFDPEKTIRLDPQLIAKKVVCRSNVEVTGETPPEYVTTYLVPETFFIGNLERSGDHLYPGADILKTESGYLGIPKQRSDGIMDYVDTEQVTTTTSVTLYDNVEKTREVPNQRTVTKYNTVEHVREITQTRTLWEELILRMSW